MKRLKGKARNLLKEFKGEDYIFGIDCLGRIGEIVSPFGKRTLLITNLGTRGKKDLTTIIHSLKQEGVEVSEIIPSAKPNAPREDVWRLEDDVLKASPESVVVVSGGSGIDAAKNPQLEMKLNNMPVPLTSEMIDDYMGPILEAAKTEDFRLIKNL